ncbi:hypothetical protein GQ607_015307, partial [Colletotrichum asianum]
RPSMLCLDWYLYIDTYLPKVDVVCRSCPCKCKSKVKSGQVKQGQPGDVKLPSKHNIGRSESADGVGPSIVSVDGPWRARRVNLWSYGVHWLPGAINGVVSPPTSSGPAALDWTSSSPLDHTTMWSRASDVSPSATPSQACTKPKPKGPFVILVTSCPFAIECHPMPCHGSRPNPQWGVSGRSATPSSSSLFRRSSTSTSTSTWTAIAPMSPVHSGGFFCSLFSPKP